jgi:DNA-binding transcriptional LysR family regulator
LEDWLGTTLFGRTNRGLSLTDAGASYLPAVRDVLTVLASASEQIPGKHARPHLAMSVTPTFAARLLLPRLARFTAKHQSLQIDIDTSYRTVEFPRDGFDIAIRLGNGAWPGLSAAPLLTEVLVPVCSPELFQRIRPGTSLCDAPLIHVTTITEDWITWARATAHGDIDCKRGLMVDTIHMSMDAAVQGLGIALGRRPMVEQELNAGTLVTAGLPSARAERGYWMVGLPETMTRPEIMQFREWLQSELADFEAMALDKQWRASLPTAV